MTYPLNLKACCCCGTTHPAKARKCKGPCGVMQTHWRTLTSAEFNAELVRRETLRRTLESVTRPATQEGAW
jgi:hypothetical protein